jgi:hypothetical protein
LDGLRGCSEGYANSDADERQTALSWGKVVVALKDDWEAGEESIECAVEDGDVDGEEENNGFCNEKYCIFERLDHGHWEVSIF